MSKVNPATQAITGNFVIQGTMPNGKSMNVSGYLYDGESVESAQERMSRFHDMLDFQRLRAEIPELEAKLDGSIRRLGEIRMHYTAMLGKRERGEKLTSQEKQALDVMDTNVQKHIEDIDKGRQAVADAKAKVGIA